MTNENRDSLVSSILAFTVKMKTILEEAKIKMSYVALPEETGNIPMAYLKEGLAWLKSIHDNEFQACLETKALIPDEQWAIYQFMDMEGSREMIDLKKNFRDLRKKIINKERPAVFRRKKFNAKQERQTQQRDAQETGQANS